MEIVLICIIAFIIIVTLSSNKKTKEQQRNERVMEILNRTHEQEKAKLEEKIAEKEAVIKEMAAATEADKAIPDEKMLISKSAFEDMRHMQKDTCDMVKDICRERDFQKYVLGIKTGNDRVDNSQKIYESLKFFIIQDILRNYSRLGYRYYSSGGARKKYCSIEFDTPEGQLLYGIVMQMMKLDDNQLLDWEEFKNDIGQNDQYSQQIRKTAIEALNTYANADVKATASNGLDDFAFCIILHNYNKEYEHT